MRATDFETILPDAPLASLPVRLEQTPSRAAPFLLAALAAPAAAVSLAPFALLAEHLTRDPSLIADRPVTSAGLIAALVVWIGVFLWPIAVRSGRASSSRLIVVTDTHIVVTDRGWLGERTWREPISAYSGISHRVRSSLSGTRHELILLHADPSRSVMLRAAPRIAQGEIDHVAALLGCREIAPRVIYATFGVSPEPVATGA